MYVWNSQFKVTFELLRDIGVLKFAYQFMFRKANLYEVQFINSRRSREIQIWLFRLDQSKKV